MTHLHCFFLQYFVRQRDSDATGSKPMDGLATVIVFAADQQIAKARAGRIIAEQYLEITSFSRIHLILEQNIEMSNPVLSSLHRRAELYGIGMHCDFWPVSSCCAHKKKSDK